MNYCAQVKDSEHDASMKAVRAQYPMCGGGVGGGGVGESGGMQLSMSVSTTLPLPMCKRNHDSSLNHASAVPGLESLTTNH